MAYCRECGSKVENTDKFCSGCGQGQPRNKAKVKPPRGIKTIALTMALIILCSIIFFKLEIFKSSKASTNLNSYEKTANVNIGDYIEFGKYLDEPILWRVINKDENGIMLFSDRILSLKAFSTYNEINENSDNFYGVADTNWEYSTIREWLNSDSELVKYTKEPPSDDHLSYNAYDQEPGFLYNLSKEEVSAIKEVKHKVLLTELEADFKDGGSSIGDFNKIDFQNEKSFQEDYYDEAIYKYVTDKVFLLSIKELKDYLHDRGWEYRGIPTESAVRQSEIKRRNGIRREKKILSAFQYWTYWLRTPANRPNIRVCTVDTYNKRPQFYISEPTYSEYVGVRPAIYIEEDLDIIQGDGSEYNPYRLYGNTFSNDETRIDRESNIMILDSPRDAVYQYLKALINLDRESLTKVLSKRNLEIMARQREVTVDSLIDDIIEHFALTLYDAEDLTIDDFQIQQPKDYQYMDKVPVKISSFEDDSHGYEFEYDSEYQYWEDSDYMFVELAPDGLWYVVFDYN